MGSCALSVFRSWNKKSNIPFRPLPDSVLCGQNFKRLVCDKNGTQRAKCTRLGRLQASYITSPKYNDLCTFARAHFAGESERQEASLSRTYTLYVYARMKGTLKV
jgi:hypothetical protein